MSRYTPIKTSQQLLDVLRHNHIVGASVDYQDARVILSDGQSVIFEVVADPHDGHAHLEVSIG